MATTEPTPAVRGNATDDAGAGGWSLLGVADEVAFIVVALLVVPFAATLLENTGAFWRDEVSTILLARASSWSAMLGALANDSFPALFASLVRLWVATGIGADDAGIRFFGGVLALAVVPALWTAAHLAGMRPPVVALALVVWNPVYLYWGTSIRAYALAAVLAVLLFGLVFALVERPTRATAVVAALVAVAAAQSNYQATYLIFAVCVAGAIVAGLAGNRWGAFACLAVGGVAALSLLPYLPVVRTVTAWNMIVQEPVTVRSIWVRVGRAVDAAGSAVGGVWRILVIGAVLAPGLAFAARRRLLDGDGRLRLYGALVILVVVAAMVAVVKQAGYPTQAWYYLPLLALAALAAEAAVRGRCAAPAWTIGCIALAALVVGLSIGPVQRQTQVRRTNMDLVAARLNADAAERDLVLVNPFWVSVSFSYYYRGRAPWLALPAIAPADAANPYPRALETMRQVDPLEPTLGRIRDTLAAGGRVWFVGGYLLPSGPPLRLAPAPDPRYGWSNGAYADTWSMQAGDFVRTHALATRRIPTPAPQPVSAFEKLDLLAIDGWRP